LLSLPLLLLLSRTNDRIQFINMSLKRSELLLRRFAAGNHSHQRLEIGI
jgi:hypothetical protein